MMIRNSWKSGAVMMVALMSIPGFAVADLGGCVNSPENPTAILAMLGAAAAGVRRWRASRNARATLNENGASVGEIG